MYEKNHYYFRKVIKNKFILYLLMGNCYSCIINHQLKKTNNDIPFFSLNGKTFDVKVVDVYDGDTCSVVFLFKNRFTKFRVRCSGYDSPEMKPLKSESERDTIIVNACKARNFFAHRTTNCDIDIDSQLSKKEMRELIKSNTKIIRMKCDGWDKYGRLLGHFYVNNIYINEEMIIRNYGYRYNGGTKQTTNMI